MAKCIEMTNRNLEELVGDKRATSKQKYNRVWVNMKDKWQKQRAIYNRQEQLSCVITKSCRDHNPMQLLTGHVPRAQHFEGDGNSFSPVSDSPPTSASSGMCDIIVFCTSSGSVAGHGQSQQHNAG